jgi:aspartokinase
MEEFGVTGVTADRGKFLLTIQLARPTAQGAIWSLAESHHLAVLAPVFSGSQVQFFAERDAEQDWRKSLEHLSSQGFINEYQLSLDQVPLSVVGYRLSQDGKALNQLIETLAHHHISVTMGSASALAITVSVPATHAEDGVKVLHQALA